MRTSGRLAAVTVNRICWSRLLLSLGFRIQRCFICFPLFSTYLYAKLKICTALIVPLWQISSKMSSSVGFGSIWTMFTISSAI